MLPQRRPNRLPDYDYSREGLYFVTACTLGRRQLFARASDGALQLTRFGKIVDACFNRIPSIRAATYVDRYVIMPDHVHAIVGLTEQLQAGSLSTIIGGFKSASSRAIREVAPEIGVIWQRSFHERIIRSDSAYHQLCDYIERNPERWLAKRRGIAGTER